LAELLLLPHADSAAQEVSRASGVAPAADQVGLVVASSIACICVRPLAAVPAVAGRLAWRAGALALSHLAGISSAVPATWAVIVRAMAISLARLSAGPLMLPWTSHLSAREWSNWAWCCPPRTKRCPSAVHSAPSYAGGSSSCVAQIPLAWTRFGAIRRTGRSSLAAPLPSLGRPSRPMIRAHRHYARPWLPLAEPMTSGPIPWCGPPTSQSGQRHANRR
jgi:hypothetical protein